LEATRAELRRTAEAQEKSEEALRLQALATQTFAHESAAQAQAMRSLAEATKEQVSHDREIAGIHRD
jgi:hypothetical protein